MADRPKDGETELIQRYFVPLAEATPGAFALSDDAGRMRPPEGHELVLTTDMIVAGVHFPEHAAPQDIACKALGVNISDLCAKGAEPAHYLMSIALPANPGAEWLEALSNGFAKAQSDFKCTLLGGDTVSMPGPLAISITAAGYVPEGGMVHRSGARAGDRVYVTGTIGDAALGLMLVQKSNKPEHLSREQADFLKNRYWRPQPRMDAISLVRNHATAAMDVSDGLVGDFAKLCAASGAGGIIEAADVPLSAAAAAWVSQEPECLQKALTGGDDYEVLMTVSEGSGAAFEKDCAASGVQITCIGHISPPGEGVTVVAEDGKALELDAQGYDHF